MHRLRLATWLVLVFTSAASAWALDDLSVAMPEEALSYMVVNRLAPLLDLREQPVVKKVWTPAVQKALAPVVAKFSEAAAKVSAIKFSRVDFAEARALFPGGVAISYSAASGDLEGIFTKSIDAATQGKGDFEELSKNEVLIAAHFTGDEPRLQKLLDSLNDPAPPPGSRTVKNIDGNRIHLAAASPAQAPAEAWAIVHGFLLLAIASSDDRAEKSLLAAVARVNQGGRSLADNARFKDLAPKIQQATFGTFENQAKVVKPFLAAIAKVAEKSGKDDDLGRMFRLLGLETVTATYSLLALDEQGLNLEQGVTYPRKPLLLKFLASNGPGQAPGFLPPSASDGFYGTFDPAKFMDALEELLMEFPTAKETYSRKLEDMKTKSGVDLKRDLLPSLGPNFWFGTGRESSPLSALPDLTPTADASANAGRSYVAGFQVRDIAAVQKTLGRLLIYLGVDTKKFSQRESQGFLVGRYTSGFVDLSYVVMKDWIILSFGPDALLDKILTRLKHPEPEHLFSQAAVGVALGRLPDGGIATFYSNLDAPFNGLRSLLKFVEQDSTNPLFAAETLEGEAESPLRFTGRIYDEPQALRFRAHLEPKSK